MDATDKELTEEQQRALDFAELQVELHREWLAEHHMDPLDERYEHNGSEQRRPARGEA